MELALAENTVAELRRKDKEMTKKFEKEMALRDKRKKVCYMLDIPFIRLCFRISINTPLDCTSFF